MQTAVRICKQCKREYSPASTISNYGVQPWIMMYCCYECYETAAKLNSGV